MNRKSTVLSVLLATTICFTNIIGSFSAYADDLDNERQAISESKAQYDLLDEQILSLNSEIANINIEIDQINTKLKDNETQIANTETEIESTKALLEQTEIEIAEKEAILSKRLRNIQKSDLMSNMLAYLLASESLTDIFDRFDAVSKIVSLDKELISGVKEKKETLTITMDELSSKETSLQALKKETENSLKELESKKAEQETKMAKLNEEQAKASEVIETNEQKLIAHSVSIIESSNTVSELQDAISTLTYLIPTLNSSTVIATANDSIYQGNLKVEEINAKAEAEAAIPSRGESITDTSTPGESSGSTALSTLTMQSTAYTGGTLTATGSKPVYNPGGISTIAVDPNVIPLGSKVYVSGYGTAIAADTGGAIKGNIIDVYFNSEADCIAWGRRTVTVEILALPGEW